MTNPMPLGISKGIWQFCLHMGSITHFLLHMAPTFVGQRDATYSPSNLPCIKVCMVLTEKKRRISHFLELFIPQCYPLFMLFFDCTVSPISCQGSHTSLWQFARESFHPTSWCRWSSGRMPDFPRGIMVGKVTVAGPLHVWGFCWTSAIFQ